MNSQPILGVVRTVPEVFSEKNTQRTLKPKFVKLCSMVHMAVNTREGQFICRLPGFKRLVERSMLLQKRQAYEQLKRLSKRYLTCHGQEKTAFRKQLIKECDHYLQSDQSSRRCSKVLKARYQLMLESSDQRNALMNKTHYSMQTVVPCYAVEQTLPALLHTVEINQFNSIQPQRARLLE